MFRRNNRRIAMTFVLVKPNGFCSHRARSPFSCRAAQARCRNPQNARGENRWVLEGHPVDGLGKVHGCIIHYSILSSDRFLHECSEERMRPVGPALKFRMELAPHHEGVPLHFHNFHKTGLRIFATEDEPFLLECILEGIIELITVAMALGNLFLPIYFECLRPFPEFADKRTKPERSTLCTLMMLPRQKVHDIFR